MADAPDWAVDDTTAPQVVERAVDEARLLAPRGPARAAPALALRLHDVAVEQGFWSTLLGGADLRLDAVVVQGNALADDTSRCYVPSTLRFPGVGRQDRLTSDEHGLLVYLGWPRLFLDLSVMVSRDRSGSADLAQLLAEALANPEFQTASTTLLGVASVAQPTATAISGGLAAAGTLGGLALNAVRKASGATVGLYRGNRLAYPDEFGLGRNPRQGRYLNRGLSLWYEVVEVPDAAPAPRAGAARRPH